MVKLQLRLLAVVLLSVCMVVASGRSGFALTGPQLRSSSDITNVAASKLFIYVANIGSNTITVYPSNANGNQRPVRTLTGPATKLNGPIAIALDNSDRLYVANGSNNSITVYPPHANGNQPPLRTIMGNHTQLSGLQGIAVDRNNIIYVTNCPGCFSEILTGFVTMYGPTANGNCSPIATLSGDKTQLSQPVGIFREPPDGPLFVANSASDTITVYDPPFKGNVAPSRIVSGKRTQLVKPLGLTMHFATGDLYVANCRSCIGTGPGTINVYAPRVNGNQGPFRVIVSNGKLDPQYVAVDESGKAYLTNVATKGDFITVFAPDANGSQPPIAVISGSNTRLNLPQGIAVGP